MRDQFANTSTWNEAMYLACRGEMLSSHQMSVEVTRKRGKRDEDQALAADLAPKPKLMILSNAS
jgi:hypothetical protein